MIADQLLKTNHDIHLHCADYSDGWASVDEVTAYALRWTDAPHWVGVSDHSPCLEDLQRQHGGMTSCRTERRLADLSSTIRRQIDMSVAAYVDDRREDRHRLLRTQQVELLIGMEVDWLWSGPDISVQSAAALDYVLMAFHGRRLRTSQEADSILRLMVRHRMTGVLAHPDQFLGYFDVRECNWQGLFSEMASRGVWCEYNLATPLGPEVFDIAVDCRGLVFTIGSDTHDIRRRSVRRITDAWAETLGGGFTLGKEYLLAFVGGSSPNTEERELAALFETPQALGCLEERIYLRTRRRRPQTIDLSGKEERLLDRLDQRDDEADRQYLRTRLRRFSCVDPERIATTWSRDAFQSTIRRCRP